MNPLRSPRTLGRGGPPSRRTSRENGRLALALPLSLLIHALLLSLTFGGQGLGLPGFGFPWRDRRIEAPDLQVVFVPARVTAQDAAIASAAEPLPQGPVAPPVAGGPAPTPFVSPAPPSGTKDLAIVPAARPTAETESKREASTAVDPAQVPSPAGAPREAAAPRIDEPPAGGEPTDGAASVAPAAPLPPTPIMTAAPGASSPRTVPPAVADADDIAREASRLAAAQLEAQRQEAARQDAERAEAARAEAARAEAARAEAVRAEAARLEAERQEAARSAAAQQEAQRQETARQEAARAEAARLEAERREAARLAEARLEAQRQEAARQEAARAEAARAEAVRQEAARQDAARLEAARLAAAQQETARIRAEQEEAREARLRAIGRQLDEERARRDEAANAARPRSPLPLSLSTARRVRLWGRADTNVELVRYAEAWERKIQLNTPVETIRELAQRLRTHPMVTVAVRSNGFVESVTFVVSTGAPEVDEAIRRIVQSHEPYPAFPPALAREFDVVEIRRTWSFDAAVRLY